MHTKTHFFNNALSKALSIMAVFLVFTSVIYSQPWTFTPSLPASGAASVSLTPAFTWLTDDTGLCTLQVYEAKDGWTPGSDPNHNPAKLVYNGTVTPAGGSASITPVAYTNTAAASRLDPNKRYVWFVKTSDNVWHSTGTVGYEFVTVDTPTITYPVNTLTGVPVLPNFTWTLPAGLTAPVAITLSVIKAETGAVATVVNPANGATSYQWSEADGILANNSTYNVTVTFTDANMVSASKTSTFKTFAVTAFGLSLPVDASTNVPRSSLPFYWYNTAGGVKYLLEAITDPGHALTAADWAVPALTADNLTAVNTTLTNLLFNQKYFWRVKAKHATTGAVLAVTGVYSFTTGGGVTTPYLSYPVDQPVYEDLPTFYWWGLNFDPANVYDLYIKNAANQTVYYKADISGNSHKLIAAEFEAGFGPALAGNSTYTWYVVAKASSAVGAPAAASGISTFTTLGAGTVFQPVLSYPTDLTEVYSVTPTLYWYLGGTTSGITYTVTLSNTSGGANLLTSPANQVTDQLNYTVPINLTPGNTYYWKVTASNGTAAQDQTSLEGAFVVSTTLLPGDPVASWPVDNPTEYSNKPTLYWWINGSSAGITGFDVVWTTGASAPADNAAWNAVFGSATPLNSASVAGTATNYTLTAPQALASGVQYYWAVRKAGGTNWSAGSFTTVSATVASNGTPVASWPTGGAQMNTTAPQLYWWMNGSTANLTSFTVVYSRTEDFAAGSDAFGDYTTTVTGLPAGTMNYQIPVNSALLQGTTYYWKVIAVFSSGGNTESAAESFVIQSANGAVAPVAGNPGNNVAINSSNPTLSWAIPVATTAPMTYEAQYATKPDMSGAVTITGLKSNKVAVSGLVKGNTYYWRVRSVTAAGKYSSYSSPERFRVAGTTEVEQRPGVPADFTLEQNYPNPFNPSTVIRFSLPKESMVTLKIYDIMGQEVKTLINGNMTAGNFDIQWNGDDSNGNKVQSGTYIYRITTESNSVARKMMMIK